MQILKNQPLPDTLISKHVSSSETIDRLYSVSQLSEIEWLDLLQMTWLEYQKYRGNRISLPDKSLLNLSVFFSTPPESIISGELDYKALELKISNYKPVISDRYMVAAFSRRRTTITTMDFIEKAYGWRLKYDVMKYFGINEAALLDPFSQISLRFLTETCSYLKHRQFQEKDFFMMGAYSSHGKQNKIIAKSLSLAPDLHDLYYTFVNELMPLFECNFSYSYSKLGKYEGLIEMKSNLDIAKELGVSTLGNTSLCNLKCGMAASLPSYKNLPYAHVWHPYCEHKGDASCKFYLDFKPCYSHTKN